MDQFYSFQDSYEEIKLLCRSATDNELVKAADSMNNIIYFSQLAYNEIYKFFNTNNMQYIINALAYANDAKKSIADVQNAMVVYGYDNMLN